MANREAFKNLCNKDFQEKYHTFRIAFVHRNLDKIKKIVDNARIETGFIIFSVKQDEENVEYAVYWDYGDYCLNKGNIYRKKDKYMFCTDTEFLKSEKIEDILEAVRVIKKCGECYEMES